MRSAIPLLLCFALLPVLGSGCGCTKDLADGLPEDPQCSSCHGSEANAAPPRAIDPKKSSLDPEVGAHQMHVTDGLLRKAVACSECHLVPETLDAPGHIDDATPEHPADPSEVVWGPLASARGASPAWDRASATCASTYCHGATLKGGRLARPVWTLADEPEYLKTTTWETCLGCHGYPPPAPHPQSDRCAGCHGKTVRPDGLIDLEGGTHIDGEVDVGGTCNTCHGSDENPAPPLDTRGQTDVAQRGVGAHQQHVRDTAIRQALACEECHVLPRDADDPGHQDGVPALTWGPLATAQTQQPTWNGTACSAVYCHGSTLAGGDATSPVWTTVDGSQAACGGCHGNPPPAPHPQSARCGGCHPGTVRADGTIDVAGGLHVDGEVQIASACNACHGSAASDAPPVDIQGGTDSRRRGVGAHQQHVQDTKVRKAVGCAECHVVPKNVGDPGHIDEAGARLTWGPLASAEGLAPAWDGTRCSSVYCHGSTLTGGKYTRPEWTRVDGVQAGCDACHGFPPPTPHSPNTRCAGCHPGSVSADGSIDLEGGQHIDGNVQVASTCDACHGSAANPAPPLSVAGETATTARAVGAHQQHLSDSKSRKAVSCSECHVVPMDVGQAEHIDAARASLVWGPLARANAQVPSWDGAACASVYCHGATLAGGTATAPVWTRVDGSQVGCDGCHGNPPPLPHPQHPRCATCHPGTTRADGTIDVAAGWHINGKVEANSACNSCHGDPQSDPAKPMNWAPPADISGATATTARGVGAHRVHLSDSPLRKAMVCADCHRVPATVLEASHMDALPAELVWGILARTGGQAPTFDGTACSSVYCHGATLAGGTITRPLWTKVDGTQAACGTCHGNPPPLPHAQNTRCATCHGGTVKPDGSIDVAGGRHVDGTLEVSSACNACHGNAAGDVRNPASWAPPVDVSGNGATSARGVGAHQSHLKDAASRKALTCADCHKVPATVTEAGHLDSALPAELTWGALAKTGGQSPAFDGATCTSTYCHGATLSGGTNTRPLWARVDGTQAACGTCHGNPPPQPHPQASTCSTCHPGTTLANGAIDVAGGKHIDGALTVASACNACHGDSLGSEALPRNWAPPTDVSGNAAKTARGVGAHQEHLRDGAVRVAMACPDCHRVPTAVSEAGHMDSALPAELTWGALAKAGGAQPAFDGTRCSSTYCHGATLGGGTNKAPQWAKVDGTQASCGTCHGNPPPAHYGTQCSGCHPDVAADGTLSDKTRHVDGRLDLEGGECGACHGVAPATGAHQAHFGDATTKPAYGELKRLADYYPAGKPYSMFACGHCHPLDAARHMDGQTQIELYNVAAPAGTLKALSSPTAVYDKAAKTCSGVYCHSSGQAAPVFRTSPGWTSGVRIACDGCHDNPPRYASGGAGAASANTHVQLADDGWELGHFAGLEGAWHRTPNKHGGAQAGSEAAPITCQTCHFDTTDPANTGPSGFYWLDTTGTFVLPGGDANRLTTLLPGYCTSCHKAGGTAPAGKGRVLPLKHVNGSRDVAFDTRALPPAVPYATIPTGTSYPALPYFATNLNRGTHPPDEAQNGTTWSVSLTQAAYDARTKTCTNVACHLDQKTVQWGISPVGWATCDACHGYGGGLGLLPRSTPRALQRPWTPEEAAMERWGRLPTRD